MKEKLKFSTNSNNKLNCDVFTTIRLHSRRYFVGTKFDIELKGKHLKSVQVVEVTTFKLEDINEYIAGIDCGRNAKDAKEMVKRFCSKNSIDWETQKLDFVLLKTIK